MGYEFPKQNKLCGQQRIAQFYCKGKRFIAWPLRVTWSKVDDKTQILIWAPKSLFKHAVQRNRIRRLMREAYRLHQDILGDAHYQIAFNYMDKEEQSLAVIEKAVQKSLKKIVNEQ